MKQNSTTTSKVGRRGTVVIPSELRKRFGMDEGTLVIAEERDGGVLIRPAIALPVEHYSPHRKAEFLLNNAIDDDDYRKARQAVTGMGLDPDEIPHQRPKAA